MTVNVCFVLRDGVGEPPLKMTVSILSARLTWASSGKRRDMDDAIITGMRRKGEKAAESTKLTENSLEVVLGTL